MSGRKKPVFEAAMTDAMTAGLSEGTVRLELDANIFGGQLLIRAQVIDPVFPRRKPKRLFPAADVIYVDSYPEGLRMLADLIEASS